MQFPEPEKACLRHFAFRKASPNSQVFFKFYLNFSTLGISHIYNDKQERIA